MRYQWEHAVAAPLSEPGGRILVEKIAGDALCAKLAFKPDVIKIDVEGHELKVINGLIQTIIVIKPLLFLAEILQMNPKPASMFAFSRPSCKTDARCRPLPAPRVTRALGRGSDLAISPGIWTHSFCRLLLNA